MESKFNHDRAGGLRTDKFNAQNINEYLEPGETIIWQGKPDRTTYIRKCTGVPFIFALIWTIFDSFFLVAVFASGMPIGAAIGVLAFLAVHMTPVWIHIGGRIKGHRIVDSLTYYVTNKRCILENQKNHYKFNYVKHEDITTIKADEINYFNSIGSLTIQSRVYKLEFTAVTHYADIHQVINNMKMNSQPDRFSYATNPKGTKEVFKCSYCGQTFMGESSQCPGCGARADVETQQ
ncbi:MAG: hypothetical protein E7354_01170 [Clostridiales bacterium]|nr:hypothetical protein [Clostridiales bacterium]